MMVVSGVVRSAKNFRSRKGQFKLECGSQVFFELKSESSLALV